MAERIHEEEWDDWREEQGLDETDEDLEDLFEEQRWDAVCEPLRHNPEYGNPEEPGPTTNDLYEVWP